MLTLQKETAPLPKKKPPRKRKSEAPLIVFVFALVVWATSGFWAPVLKDLAREFEEKVLNPAERASRAASERVKIDGFSPHGAEAGARRLATINGVEFAFRYCPPGRCLMGSPDGEGNDNERPQHYIRQPQGFWLMETELTQEQWRAVTGENPSSSVGENLPVETISWNDCRAFIDKLNRGLGGSSRRWRFALPTEAQWEYACRAGTTGPRYGNLDEIARYINNSGGGICPVGALAPNAWGLRDMLGNVWEWCEDQYEDYSKDPRTRQNVGPDDKVSRGGGWGDGFVLIAATRTWNSSEARFNFLGARLAYVPPLEFERTSGFLPTGAAGDSSRQALEEESRESSPEDLAAEIGRAGERRVLTINGVEFAFRYCPRGWFELGSLFTENERPVHKVILSKGFWIMETELTQKQWKAITGDDPSRFKGENRPVETVSWNDCQEFIAKLNDELKAAPEGWRFSLPTEAQWEYAANGGTSLDASHHDRDRFAWHSGNSDRETRDVGKLRSNYWGVYDAFGNVAEWCEDAYGPYGDADRVVDPISSGDGKERAIRGGHFRRDSDGRACIGRETAPPEAKDDSWGARLALVQDGAESK